MRLSTDARDRDVRSSIEWQIVVHKNTCMLLSLEELFVVVELRPRVAFWVILLDRYVMCKLNY